MKNLFDVDRDITRLHPAIRGKVKKIQAQLKKENIPLEVFEAFRTPQRQGVLAKKRPRVTWVKSWGSIHQYGLAVDFVIRKSNGGWSWDDSDGKREYWLRMHEIALENGMRPLRNKKGDLMELPHIQMTGISSSELSRGIYPDGGDLAWGEHLAALIDSWAGPGKAPPKPDIVGERPPLDPSQGDEIVDNEDMENAHTDKISSALEQAAANAQFQKFNRFVARVEGGFVNHPDDKGGATNMGVTIRTLAAWRGGEVSEEDVRNLTREEADAIYFINYYSACRCSEMPARMAMVVYNCAVLSGPKRAVEFVQKGFNALGLHANGGPLEVDGVLGPMTMGALRKTDASALSEAFMDVQEAYLRGLDTFPTFGAGWLNRMGALREFVNTLPQGAGVRPTNQMKVSDSNGDMDDLLRLAISLKTGGGRGTLKELAGSLLHADTSDSSNTRRNKLLLELLLGDRLKGGDTSMIDENPIEVVNAADGKPPLTPVNAALGQTVGRALNGKKSVSGIIGLLLTTLLPQVGLSGDIVDFLSNNSQTLLTLFSLVTGWGFLGKIDKAIRLVGAGRSR